jgi:predicted ATP-dependent Lon-type protease
VRQNHSNNNGNRSSESYSFPLRNHSVRIAEQNLYACGAELVGDRNPREHEFTVQLRSFDAARSADHTGVPVLLALSSALLGRPLKGGLAVVGGINLGGSIEPVHNSVDLVEHALSKGASARRGSVFRRCTRSGSPCHGNTKEHMLRAKTGQVARQLRRHFSTVQ